MKKKYKNNGFSLVEIAIVLIIIAVVAAGVLQGQEMIHQARLRAQIAQLKDFDRAYSTFRLKYSSIPGDYSEASKEIDSTAADGNENGSIEMSEELPYWNHLSLAKILSDTYIGGNTETGTQLIPGTTIPKGKINNICIQAWDYLDPTSYRLGALWVADGACTQGGFSPEELKFVDTKLDDGLPLTGLLKGITGYDPALEDFYTIPCTVTSGTTTYNTASSKIVCRSIYRFLR